MNQIVVALDASLAVALTVYLLLYTRRFRPTATPPESSNPSDVPEYSLAAHKVIRTGTVTVLSFPTPPAHGQYALPFALRTVYSTGVPARK